MVYFLVSFTLDIAGAEIFWWTQVFTSVDFSFVTKRGLITGLSLITSLAGTCIVTTATLQTYRDVKGGTLPKLTSKMLDYCFTVFVLHFIIVSIVLGEFPANGAWWTASAVGVALFMILSERLR